MSVAMPAAHGTAAPFTNGARIVVPKDDETKDDETKDDKTKDEKSDERVNDEEPRHVVLEGADLLPLARNYGDANEPAPGDLITGDTTTFEELLELAKNYDPNKPIQKESEHAQSSAGDDANDGFSADTNRDGKLSFKEQFALVEAGKIDAIDSNGDGRVDIDDFRIPAFLPLRTDLVGFAKRAEATLELDNSGSASLYSNGRLVIYGEPISELPSDHNVIKVTHDSKHLYVTVIGVGRKSLLLKKVKSVVVYCSQSHDELRLPDLDVPVLVYAMGGNDTISGGSGAETIYGGDGSDSIHGGGGDDALYGVNGNDRIWGEGGDDRIEGGRGDDRLDGGRGKNRLAGNDGIDRIGVRAKDKTDRDKKDKLTELE